MLRKNFAISALELRVIHPLHVSKVRTQSVHKTADDLLIMIEQVDVAIFEIAPGNVDMGVAVDEGLNLIGAGCFLESAEEHLCSLCSSVGSRLSVRWMCVRCVRLGRAYRISRK